MNFFTHIAISRPPRRFSYADRFLLLGSCFAQNMAGYMKENRFDMDVNPSGTLYNPASISRALRILLEGKTFSSSDLFRYGERWYSWMHQGSFSGMSEAECLETINPRLIHAEERLGGLSCLIITWGTAYIYRLRSTGEVVSNCHKVAGREFMRERLSVGDIVADWSELLGLLVNRCPSLQQIILSVSPIRHWKDGAHGNQLSKATLLLAAEQLEQKYPGLVQYFPAYEIMMDELRDYRFYADDMLHPSPQAVEYIWDSFRTNYLTEETLAVMEEWQQINQALHHRPLHPESDAYREFMHQTMLKLKRLQEKFPYFGDEKDEA